VSVVGGVPEIFGSAGGAVGGVGVGGVGVGGVGIGGVGVGGVVLLLPDLTRMANGASDAPDVPSLTEMLIFA
jgi:hypothetical protein